MSAISRKIYLERVGKVIDYVYVHLDEPLDLYRLADIACMSAFHWHRVYQGICGETISATVKRLRLHRAAGYLVQSEQPQSQIARASGYSNVQSFSRAFSQAYGMPPARYRKQGSLTQFKLSLEPEQTHVGDATMYQVELKAVPVMKLVGIPHKGSYMGIGQGFEPLFAWLGVNGLIDDKLKAIGIYYDDPSIVDESQLRAAACAYVPALDWQSVESPMEEVNLSEGEYAVIRHIGPYANLRGVYEWFCTHWLPSSGREFDDKPVFEEYLNNAKEVAPTELITDIYLPLKPL